MMMEDLTMYSQYRYKALVQNPDKTAHSEKGSPRGSLILKCVQWSWCVCDVMLSLGTESSHIVIFLLLYRNVFHNYTDTSHF